MQLSRKASIRQLRPGELVPTSTPHRYSSAHGYIRLRWQVAPRRLVETYEHRVFDGMVTDAEHVHHENHDRTDNRRENLRPLTAAEHMAEHGDHRRKVDPEAVTNLYMEGMTQREIAAAVGYDSGNVSRILKRAGVPIRSQRSRYPYPEESALRSAYDVSRSAIEVADRLNLPVSRVRAALVHFGLRPFPPGRPR